VVQPAFPTQETSSIHAYEPALHINTCSTPIPKIPTTIVKPSSTRPAAFAMFVVGLGPVVTTPVAFHPPTSCPIAPPVPVLVDVMNVAVLGVKVVAFAVVVTFIVNRFAALLGCASLT